MLSLKVRGDLSALRLKEVGGVSDLRCRVKSVHPQNYQLMHREETDHLGDKRGPTGGYVC